MNLHLNTYLIIYKKNIIAWTYGLSVNILRYKFCSLLFTLGKVFLFCFVLFFFVCFYNFFFNKHRKSHERSRFSLIWQKKSSNPAWQTNSPWFTPPPEKFPHQSQANFKVLGSHLSTFLQQVSYGSLLLECSPLMALRACDSHGCHTW